MPATSFLAEGAKKDVFMRNLFKKYALIPLFFLTFTSCAGTGTGVTLASIVTIANLLGTWTATGGNAEDIESILITDTGETDSAAIDVVFSNASTDTGFVEFTDNNNTNREITVYTSATGYIYGGTISLSDDCQKMNLTLEGESGTFEQDGNGCTDHAALVLE